MALPVSADHFIHTSIFIVDLIFCSLPFFIFCFNTTYNHRYICESYPAAFESVYVAIIVFGTDLTSTCIRVSFGSLCFISNVVSVILNAMDLDSDSCMSKPTVIPTIKLPATIHFHDRGAVTVLVISNILRPIMVIGAMCGIANFTRRRGVGGVSRLWRNGDCT